MGLLLTATLLPLGGAHLTNPGGSWTSALFSDGDNCRWEGASASGSDCFGTSGISGTYVNSHQAFITGGDVFPLKIGNNEVFPRGYWSATYITCDYEHMFTAPFIGPGNEEVIDHQPAPGSVEDGTWDDGGNGGACHRSDYGEPSEYNVAGCGENDYNNERTPSAHAEDKTSGSRVWIGAACDVYTNYYGNPQSGEMCVTNRMGWGGTVDVLDPTSNVIIEDCIGQAEELTGFPPVLLCGPDGIADIVNYGPGGGSLGVGVPYPLDPSTCVSFAGDSAVFTFNYITFGGQPHNPSASPSVIPATAGWIDSRDGLAGGSSFGPGLTIPLP